MDVTSVHRKDLSMFEALKTLREMAVTMMA
jgi:hypothetical protein